VDELLPIKSVEKVFLGLLGGMWDLGYVRGVFLNHSNLTRLLTDYGFQGYPLRKDFPLSGFTESRYNVIKPCCFILS
jgi:hypothetical protein